MEFPWQYSFPPFFTLQPHAPTRDKQLEAWKHLVLAYCQSNSVSVLDLAEAGDLPLFHNSQISRRLGPEDIRGVCDHLESNGNLEWTDKSKKRAFLYWKSPAQVGMEIYSWIQETGQTGTVLTLSELTEEEGRAWSGMSQQVIVKALKTLQADKKAEVFDDNEGVKFF